MRHTSLYNVAAAVLLATLIVGCGVSRETATVISEVERTASTETTQVEQQPVASVPSPYDTVTAQRFDRGKMWTFENPPIDYFEEAYGFRPDETWFRKARLGALRISGCSASFVSPHGLVMTNHHCGRESITKVSREGENLLDEGFYAASLDEERKVEDYYVEQLVEIEDVTKRVNRRVREGGDTRTAGRDRVVQQMQEEMTASAKNKDDRLKVEVVSLYSGARYSAYTYRRYEDVRLVMAPELQLGFFGGAPDNFTYPRHTLDVTFFRVYGEDGEPITPSQHFSWSLDGSSEGEAVFVVGNPGSTSRLNTVSQLKYTRDHDLPKQLDFLRRRAEILTDYVRENPEEADENGLRNTYFSVDNSIKSLDGQLRGLRDPYLVARRAKAEQALQDSVEAVDSLRARYADVLEEVAQLQRSKQTMAEKTAAFAAFSSTQLGSRVLTRAVYGYFYDTLKRRGAAGDRLEEIKDDALSINDWPEEVERAMIVARLDEIRDAFGTADPTMQRLFRDRTPGSIADSLVENSALMDSTKYAEMLDESFLDSQDPAVGLINAIAPLFFNTNRQMSDFTSTEERLNGRLSRARFAVFGTNIPPDATFTLRLADGVVKSYPYNGTTAAAYTNFYGLYDHYYSYGSDAWSLPEQWVNQPEDLNLDTPLNLVTTNDITGGNSGSPLLNKDLEVVGLMFDSNIEALPNEFLYTQKVARAIAVDARGILEALEDVYGARRIVTELSEGRLVESESASTSAR